MNNIVLRGQANGSTMIDFELILENGEGEIKFIELADIVEIKTSSAQDAIDKIIIFPKKTNKSNYFNKLS